MTDILNCNQFSSSVGREESKFANNQSSDLIDPSLEGGDVEGGRQIGGIRCDVHPTGDKIKHRKDH